MMKIRTDTSDLVYQSQRSARQGRITETKTSREVAPTTFDPQLVQSLTSRMNTERSLGEALSIAQASQSLLQKALIISSQLRNMAAQAAATGKVNSSDLGNMISDINSSFSAYNKGAVSPVGTYTLPDSGLPELPGIKAELDKVNSVAQSIQNGVIPERGRIDEIDRSIAQKNSIYDSFIKTATKRLSDITESYEAGNKPGPEAYRQAHDLIGGNPKQAMIAQGNISPIDVYRIFNS